ncbi:MAG: SEC-C metal-binding domain-containing protein [Patescibacteria group bacterium]|nr:SEC-C metal-binding domain-containing protein [Patescibacteria group bacterium]
MALFDFYQNWTNQKTLNNLKNKVSQVNVLEKKAQKLKDPDFKKEIQQIKQDLKDKKTTLDQALPWVFALTREGASRTLNQRHFDEQLMGGIVLHEKGIAEMKTGEGKTLAATPPIVLNALTGKGVHLITVNDYLVKLHASWMGQIYHFLGLTVGAIGQGGEGLIYDPNFGPEEQEEAGMAVVEAEHLRPASRKEAYACDITYGTNSEFGFDYLRDNMSRAENDLVQRPLYFAVIDEVDSVLIDEARTPLIISAPAAEAEDLYQTFARIVNRLNPEEDYNIDEKEHAVSLTDIGTEKVEKMLGVSNIYDPIQTQKYGGAAVTHYLYEALQAKALYQKNKSYIVKEGNVIIVDEFTGRLMPDRRYSEGLHQAIEAKEGVKIKQESLTLATISLQNYFRLYKKLAGMTGTASTESEEFRKIYNLDVVTIPTHRPMVRQDHADLIYKTEQGKFEAVVREIKKRNQAGQPILVGTLSIEKSEKLSKMLKLEGIKHEVLNAKHHEKEAKIIAKAGRLNSVTIATNMAGRGVDIILETGATDLGGLCVIGTERHESRRIDNQLRGRSGRQGDPGESIFFVSLEDDLMRIFGGDRIKNMMNILRVPEDQPIQSSMVSRGLESAQKKVESYNFDIRKHLLEFDNVLNKQREKIYRSRREILYSKNKNLETKINEVLTDALLYCATLYFSDKKQANVELAAIFPFNDLNQEVKKRAFKTEEDLFEFLKQLSDKVLADKKKQFGENFHQVIKQVYLSAIDSLWIDHLTTMDQLRQSVSLRGYGQKDPLTEYKKEGYRLFQELNEAFNDQVAKVVLKIMPVDSQMTRQEQNMILSAPNETAAAGSFDDLAEENKSSDNQRITQTTSNFDARIGRNDPCPCGSGKKYKKCHLGQAPNGNELTLFNLYCENPEEWQKRTGMKVKNKS